MESQVSIKKLMIYLVKTFENIEYVQLNPRNSEITKNIEIRDFYFNRLSCREIILNLKCSLTWS